MIGQTATQSPQQNPQRVTFRKLQPFSFLFFTCFFFFSTRRQPHFADSTSSPQSTGWCISFQRLVFLTSLWFVVCKGTNNKLAFINSNNSTVVCSFFYLCRDWITKSQATSQLLLLANFLNRYQAILNFIFFFFVGLERTRQPAFLIPSAFLALCAIS